MSNIAQVTKPLAEQIADKIKDYIIHHDLKSGEKIPTEHELVETMGVGRSTIREAVKILASRNILDVRHGAGTFVAPNMGISDDPLGFMFIKDKQKLTRDLLEIRMIIEPPIAALAAKNATEEDIVELEQLYHEVEALILSGKPYIEEDVRFHQKIAEASKNLVVPNLTPLISQAVDLFTTRTSYALTKETLVTHRDVMEAIKIGDSTWAQDAMTLHLIYNRDALRRIERRELGLE